MKLQAALDFDNLRDALALMEVIHPYVDIAEIGTPLMLAEGTRAVAEVKRRYPSIDVLADMKIMDGGESIAGIAFRAGADIVTVLGVTNDATISGVVQAARHFGKRAFADTLAVTNLAERTRQLDKLGVDYISVHTAYDLRDCIRTPIDALKVIQANLTHAKSAISGGVNVAIMPEIRTVGPEIVIVGSALTTAQDPLAVARALRKAMDE